MSNTTADLRQKIDGAKDLISVVRTMKAVAASSIGQYENSVRALADYYRSVEIGLGACLRGATQANPFAEKKQRLPSRDAIVFGSDQGLVGQFNDTVADFALKTLLALPGETRVWAVGERVHARLVDSEFPVIALFELPSSVKGIAPLIGKILLEREKLRDRDDASGFYLFYNRLRSVAEYSPITWRLLPLDQEWHRDMYSHPWPTGRYSQIFGDGNTTLRAFIREYLFVSLFRACAESLASENASRLAAMQRADHTIEELLQAFNGTFHRLRKDRIDEELFEVIAAFDTLKRG